jgi:hypothetical protein
MRTNRRKFIEKGIASVAGVALAGKTFALTQPDNAVPKITELCNQEGDYLNLPMDKAKGLSPVTSEYSVASISLSSNDWLIATDPENIGKEQQWGAVPRPDAMQMRVPWIIQEKFPGYSGVAWYWLDFIAPVNPHIEGRYLLRFWNVDYLADLWFNGVYIGQHEGAQAKFTFDTTDVVKPGARNRIAVRVLSPFNQPIDGFIRDQTPHGGYTSFNLGGIMDSVEFMITPQIRMDDLFVRADPQTGNINIEAEIWNESKSTMRGLINFVVAPATSGETVGAINLFQELKPGINQVKTELHLGNQRLWQLNDPYLYRITGRISAVGSKSVSEISTRFGFRDFRFENGYFRLNGRRIFWCSAHTGADSPGSIILPHDPDLLRRDLVDMKAMGFNGVRFISTIPQRYQLELCDEIGLMVYEESYASWQLRDSPQVAERMNRSFTGMVLRDRNHPCVVMWGLLNETGLGNVFNHAVASLPLMRRLDDSRIVVLGSGRFDSVGNTMNGLEIWKPETGFAPCLTHNPKTYSICCVALWRPNEVTLLPGINGEYSAVRWTAPVNGDYKVSAIFRGSGTFTTTDIHILHNGKPRYDNFINLKERGDYSEVIMTLNILKGQTIDFVVGGKTPADGQWIERWDDNTVLKVEITSGNGKSYDLATEFSKSNNPNGVWSYGWLKAGPTPDTSTFKTYTKCQTEKYDVLGGLSNPGSDQWEDVLSDTHYYPRVPHRELEIARLRTISGNDHHQFLSEYGIGSAVDLPRILRQCEQAGLEKCDLANQVRKSLNMFMDSWMSLKLADTFANPEDFFKLCVAKMAGLKRMGINALRSNPNIVAYSMTGCNDPLAYGEGFITAFRELKPGATDAIFEGLYPIRWSTFAEPVNVYRGSKVHLEAVLVNEDAVKPGQYPARLEVVGPNNERIFSKLLTVTIPVTKNGEEPTFAIPVFSEELPIDGPSGKYKLLVTFESGVAASGGESEFYITDPAEMPIIKTEVAMWGNDPEIVKWLTEHGIKVYDYQPGKSNVRQIILVSNEPYGQGNVKAWQDLARRMAEGSTVVFLSLDVFKKGESQLGWLPLVKKGTMGMISEYTFPQVYLRDEWVKRHPLFDGLPSGGLMDYTFYREIIPDWRYWGQDIPDEPVVGAFRNSTPDFHSELMLSVYNMGSGRFILNSLRVRQELGHDPTAERLLRNMLTYAEQNLDKPPTSLTADFDKLLETIGYK